MMKEDGLMSITKTKRDRSEEGQGGEVDGYFECKCRYVKFLVRQDRRTVVYIVIEGG
jgi:hypothetical protein